MDCMNRLKHYILAFATLCCVAMMSVGCSDDDSFSTSRSNTLSFNDTLSLDTIFSTMPSPHKLAYVLNNSGDGIRILSARLEKGNQTGFRVNVNGTYLSDVTGYQVRDLELRKGDSIRVFVEATTRQGKDLLPRLISDKLIFTLENGAKQILNLTAWTWDAQIMRNAHITTDSTLQNVNGMPIVIDGDIVVDTLKTLTVAPGTTLYFHGKSGIDVKGTLKLMGEKGNEVTLRCDRFDRMVSNMKYDNNPGEWKGIHLHSGSYDNEIHYTNIMGATNAVVCDSSHDATRSNLMLSHSTIHHAKGVGVSAYSCNVKILNSQISNSFGSCLSFVGGNVNINQSTIAQYYAFDAGRGSALYFANAIKEVEYPLTMTIQNSIIKGYANDEVIWSYGKLDKPLDVRFENCLVRTPEPEEEREYKMFKNCIFEELEDTAYNADCFFKLFDTHEFFYDFTPKEWAPSVGKANSDTSLPDDRNGNERSMTKPDLGCFELKK